MVCEDTLKIKNLPKCLTDEEKEDFLRHFGATHIKIITSKLKQKSTAFAKFESSQVAKSVLQRIHQIKLLDSILSVQYAENDIGQPKPTIKTIESENNKNKKYYKTFITKINAFNSSVSFNQPPPAYLKYEYPKPNRATINNIAHALASIPKFYTQVLHLMNKMNLPPPFSDIPDPPPRPPPNPTPVPEPKESSESEIESDSEDKNKEIIPMKRKLPQKKVVKRPKFIKPAIAQTTSQIKEKCEDVFEKVDLLQRKIELKVSSECLDNKVETEKVVEVQETPEKEIVEEKSGFITEAELNANRIPLKDLNVLPVFKDYHPGIPSSRLYIKNIAKTVEKSDLEYIYGRYKKAVEESEDVSVFDIRLMQEGRMKGQAFITFDSIEIAQTALNNTNGFILKDKPLVVVFGRAAVAKK